MRTSSSSSTSSSSLRFTSDPRGLVQNYLKEKERKNRCEEVSVYSQTFLRRTIILPVLDLAATMAAHVAPGAPYCFKIVSVKEARLKCEIVI